MLSAGSKVYVTQTHTDIFQTCSSYIPEWYYLFTADAEHIVSFCLFTFSNFYTWNEDLKSVMNKLTKKTDEKGSIIYIYTHTHTHIYTYTRAHT